MKSSYPYTADELKVAEESKKVRTPVKKKGNGSGHDDEFKPKDYTFKFGRPFQIKILGLMLEDQHFLSYVAPHIKPEHFTYKDLATIFTTITTTHEKHKCPVTHAVLVEEIAKLIRTGKIAEDYEKVAYAKILGKVSKPVREAGYVRDEIEEFIKHMSMEVGILQAVELHKRKKYDDIPDAVHSAHQEASFIAARDYSPFDKKQLTERLKARSDMLRHPEKYRGIPTGIDPLDRKLFWGGLGRKELGVVMGPPNSGKTPFLLHVAVEGLKVGHVILYSLELDRHILDLRLDANITRIPINDLTKMSAEDTQEAVEDWKKKLGLRGELYVNDLPPYDLTPAILERDIEGYKRRGIMPALVVVDYADLMAADSKRKEKRHEFTDIYTQLRGIAKRHDVGVWTASQTNRKSFKKTIIRLDDVAEDWGKAMVADYVIGLCQTDKEAQAKPQQMRLFLAKNRNGQKEVTAKTTIDFSRMRMFVIEVAEEEEEKRGEKKVKIKEMIERGDKSVEEIAKEVGCSERHVHNVKKQMKDAKNLTD